MTQLNRESKGVQINTNSLYYYIQEHYILTKCVTKK